MGKRFWSVAVACALIAGVFSSLPARAQEAPAAVVPEIVQIDDPVGDANGVNDQDNLYSVPVSDLHGEGDHVGPAGGTATDIRKVWFSHTASDISLNIQLNGNPGNLAYDTYFRFSSNIGEGPIASDALRGCLEWKASVNGTAGAYDGATEGVLTDKCNDGAGVVGPLVVAPAAEEGGGFVLTVTFPRAASPLLADGQKLTAPFGVSRIVYVGPTPTTATAVTLDNTKRGTDYEITAGGPVTKPEEPKVEPPGKSDPPGKGKKKGCGKGKGKKKGACPSNPPKGPTNSCPAYVPGEEGAEAETAVVTDAATEEAPLVIELEAPAGLANDLGVPGIVGQPSVYDETASIFHNIQVDSAAADAGLYVRYEFPDHHDYDLYLNRADGSTAANSGDFNMAPGEGLGSGGPDGGWEAGTNYEQVMGVRTADCAGYTARLVSYLTTGGATTLKIWLGDATVDGIPAESGETAMEMFYRVMGL